MEVASFYAQWVLGGSARREVYECGDFQRHVIWVETDRWPMAGQNLFGTIFLNESVLLDRSDFLTDYVFFHEVGHSQFHPILNVIIFAARLMLMGIALLSLTALAGILLILLIQASNFTAAVVAVVAIVVLMVVVLIPLIAVSWLDEGHSELFAVSHIGIQQYQECIMEKRNQSNSGRLKRAVSRIMYPPPKLVVWWANRRK